VSHALSRELAVLAETIHTLRIDLQRWDVCVSRRSRERLVAAHAPQRELVNTTGKTPLVLVACPEVRAARTMLIELKKSLRAFDHF
jgi:hypothetical protein